MGNRFNSHRKIGVLSYSQDVWSGSIGLGKPVVHSCLWSDEMPQWWRVIILKDVSKYGFN